MFCISLKYSFANRRNHTRSVPPRSVPSLARGAIAFSTFLLVLTTRFFAQDCLAQEPPPANTPQEKSPQEKALSIGFNESIRSILADRCFSCHGPDEKKREADLRLDTREGATMDLGGHAAIVAGSPETSELIARIISTDPDLVMPPPSTKKPPLTTEEVALLKTWIAQGATYEGHWAFLPIENPIPPATRNQGWSRNAIDHFILARLEQVGLSPSSEADRATLIRRVSLDLTGLPPTPAEIDSFVHDPSPNAYENVVERLLQSPHYGERWGRHWLDQARYADSNGYAVDGDREMWPYRDWVLEAINRDMPFDQFTREQIAGDLLPNPTKSQLAATAFHRNTLINQEGGTDGEQFRVESVMDRVNTTGAVWLGLTLGCAQCHTHKYDPIAQREYYQWMAFFNSTTDVNNTGTTLDIREGELFGLSESHHELTETPADRILWSPIEIIGAQTESQQPLERLEFGVLKAAGKLAENEIYRVEFQSNLPSIRAIRLKVLTDPSLPKNGPGLAANGNFVLSGIELWVDGKKATWSGARADHSQPNFAVAGAIDNDPKTGWAINIAAGDKQVMNAPHEATFVLSNEVSLTASKPKLEVVLKHEVNKNFLIGKFQIEVSGDDIQLKEMPTSRLAKLMIMKELEAPRETYLLTRGDFTRPAKEAGTLVGDALSAVPPALAADQKRDRLALANWLVDPFNPLTRRVTMNRVWMRFFGRGLVETEEDFGTQGTPPSHPELLDWLSTRFLDSGWSMKHIHRTIVCSATYRQSSNARPELNDVDPRNRFLARQERIRLEGEIVRDVALKSSGMLTHRIGGPSVHPPQPAGVYAFTQNVKKWDTETGENRYRRALYTFFYRSSPYPLLTTFDSPDFQTVCTKRLRSNTPLQSLTMANDRAFIEIAQGAAHSTLREVIGGNSNTIPTQDLRKELALSEEQVAAVITRLFVRMLGRAPHDQELNLLSEFFFKQRSAVSEAIARKSQGGDVAAATADIKLLSNASLEIMTTASDAHALVLCTRALMNTDNFITRE